MKCDVYGCECNGANGMAAADWRPRHEPATKNDEPLKQLDAVELARFEVHHFQGARAAHSKSDQMSTSSSSNKSFQLSEEDETLLVVRLAKIIPGLGIMMAMGSSIMFGSSFMLVKLMTSVHSIQVAVIKALIQTTIYAAIVVFRNLGFKPAPGELWPVSVRAVLAGTSLMSTFYALRIISLADATTIRYSMPIWTLILSYFFLAESCSLTKICAMVASFMGVVLIAKPNEFICLFNMVQGSLGLQSDEELLLLSADQFQATQQQNAPLASQAQNMTHFAAANSTPTEEAAQVHVVRVPTGPDSSQQLFGCLLALISSICLAMSLVCLRLCRRTPAEIIIMWLSFCGVILGSGFLVISNNWRLPDNLKDWSLILLNATLASIGQWLVTNAIKVEQSGVVALGRSVEILVAFAYGLLLLGEQVSTPSIVGALLVATGVFLVIVPKLFGVYTDDKQVESGRK